MDEKPKCIESQFKGRVISRDDFLRQVRMEVIRFTGERMSLDALIVEIAKNIYDHAQGLGSMKIVSNESSYEFEIKDEGSASHDPELCSTESTLAGNGVNFGIGLELIQSLATSLGITLTIDVSKGFCYSGIYTPKRFQ